MRPDLDTMPPEPPAHGPEVRALEAAARAYMELPPGSEDSADWWRCRRALRAALEGLHEPLRRQNAWRERMAREDK